MKIFLVVFNKQRCLKMTATNLGVGVGGGRLWGGEWQLLLMWSCLNVLVYNHRVGRCN